jgi:hypothetical protein
VTSRPLSSEGPFGRFADRLLAVELPDLPDAARADTVAFVCRRAAEIPSPLRIGVTVLTIACGVAERAVGIERTTAFLRSTRLPFVGELARMVRSLGFAYIWETWPSTSPAGAPAGAPGGGS